MSKRQELSTVWILTITRDVDDCKRRGDAPSSELYVYSSKEKCQKKLGEILIEEMHGSSSKRQFPQLVGSKINENTDEYEPLFIETKSDAGYYKYRFNSDVYEPTDVDFEACHEYCATGDYVEYTWMYRIREYGVQ